MWLKVYCILVSRGIRECKIASELGEGVPLSSHDIDAWTRKYANATSEFAVQCK